MSEWKYLIKWDDANDHWLYSIDGGESWHNLKADNPDHFPEACYEATEITGVANGWWQIVDEDEL